MCSELENYIILDNLNENHLDLLKIQYPLTLHNL